MSKTTAIEWARSTFNPWWGCQKVSPACAHCYAETDAKRYGHAIWGGPESARRTLTDRHWEGPRHWNEQAKREGTPWRVFCGSMCDVLEDRPDLEPLRARLWRLIEETPALTWLLLTKRPERYQLATPRRWNLTSTGWPSHVWAGTTVETQEWADRRIPDLLKAPAPVHFLSCEPLLGPLDLEPYLWPGCIATREEHDQHHDGGMWCDERRIDWVIAGGESGPHARPTHPDWVRQLRDQATAADVCFFFKQWGEWKPIGTTDGRQELPFGTYHPDTQDGFRRTGKLAAGRLLDGRTWNEVPDLWGNRPAEKNPPLPHLGHSNPSEGSA